MNRTEKFTEAISKNKGTQRLSYLLNFMESYAEYHFESEEKIMEKYDYHEINEHRKKDLDFLMLLID